MALKFHFYSHFPSRRLVALTLGLLLAFFGANTWASGWTSFIGGAAKSLTDQLEEQRKNEVQLEQQKKLLDYQYKLENERQQRAQQLEMQRQEQERTERARAQDEARRQQQIAEEKKQQEAAEQKRKAIVTGTGFFVAAGGYLVTNHHVVDDTTDYAIRDNKGHFYKATLVARDSNRDLALLKVDGSFPTLKIINSAAVSKGQRVLAVGYPQISIQGNESKVTDGIISSFTGVRNDDNWFQISVPIQGGNSGGPLVTENGGVVGVVVATANVARFYKLTGNLPQNVNYAIKSKVLLEFLNAQNLQNVSAAKGKVSVDAVDASTVLVIAKNGPIEVAYSASPEQVAREERERARAAADERRTEKQRSDAAALIAKRDAAVLKAFPDWPEIKGSDIFMAWLAEQKKEISDKLDSVIATDVVSVIRRYHAELPKFANRYAKAVRQQQPIQPPTPTMPDVAATAPNETEKPAGLKQETQPNPSTAMPTAMPMPVLASYSNVGSYPITECVKDNNTGLTWEGKSADGERGSSLNYTNYGDRRSGDASAYVDIVNAIRLCGHSDWRLPTKDELMGLVVKRIRPPNVYGIRLNGTRSINDIWFPNTQAKWYWTVTPFDGEAAFAWGIDFDYGDVGYLSRNVSNQARLVR